MSFKKIVGHEKPISIIQHNLLNSTLPNAYLFAGPRGIGKILTAWTVASAINCKKDEVDPCGVCSSCLKIKMGNHPDIFFINGSEESIKIDAIRKCRKWLSFKPYEGKQKVVLVDKAEAMTIESANAFLKTLEEPPPEVFLILTTANPRCLLPTIISRCHTLKFNPLSVQSITLILERDYDVPVSKSSMIASMSRGRIDTAVSISKDEHAFYSRELAVCLLQNAINGSIEYILKESKTITSDREGFVSILDFLSDILRDIALILGGVEERLINVDLIDSLKTLSKGLTIKWAIESFGKTQDAKYALAGNANSQLLLENLLFGMGI